jgi:hypothetical protein
MNLVVVCAQLSASIHINSIEMSTTSNAMPLYWRTSVLPVGNHLWASILVREVRAVLKGRFY